MHNKRMQSDQQIVTLVRGFSKADARFKETSGDLRHTADIRQAQIFSTQGTD